MKPKAGRNRVTSLGTIGLWMLAGACASVESGPGASDVDRQQTTIEATTAAPVPQRIPVEVTLLQAEDVDEVLTLTGTARPWDEFEISSEIAGRITAISVDEGSWVKKGQLVAELDREKRLIDLQARKADRARAQVVLEFARRKLARGRALLEKGAISESEVDALDQEVRVAETSVRIAEISIESLAEEIEDTKIHAPVSGQISRRRVSLGETVSPATPLFTLIQVNPIKVVTEIAEPYLHKIRKGSNAELVFEAISSNRVIGKVHFVHPVSNPASGAFPTEIRLLNRLGRIQPGMVARVQIKAETFRQVLVAPLDALVDFDGEYFVFAVEDGIALRKPVRILRRLGSRAVIAGEVEPGDFLVSSGNANLTDGTRVEVIS